MLIKRSLLLSLFVLSACTRESTPVIAPAAPGSTPPPFWQNVEGLAWDKVQGLTPSHADRRWLEKTVRFLRGGDGLRAGEDAAALLKLPREELIDKLSDDPRFGDLVLDFNMYFLGFKEGAVRQGRHYARPVYHYPAAIESAREALKNGDYFRLFDLYVPAYVPPRQVVDRKPEEKELSETELFWKRADEIQAGLRAVIDYAKLDPSATPGSVCDRFRIDHNDAAKFFQLGVPFNLVLIGTSLDANWYFNAFNACGLGPEAKLPEIIAALEQAYQTNAHFFREFAAFYDPAYTSPRSVSEMRTLDTKSAGIALPWMSWDLNFRLNLKNSSTNANRKRGAYVLKRFFCDDLTPIGVEAPADHTGGRHGSEVSCRSCHYKLDPISGFFRGHGVLFRDFSQSPFVIFDDLATASHEDYFAQWRAPPGSGREWNVGYVRSAKDERRNDYGSSLEDLHALFRRAPEVKRCLVKRIFEYAVGEGQTMDHGFLDQVAAGFEKRAAANSTHAFRWLVKQVLLSRTFTQPDPVPGECYDRPPGVDPSATPPCRVQALLKTNCASCHGSTDGSGSLDLTGWVTGPGGRKNFPHLGFSGEQLGAEVTMQTIMDRLSSLDPEERMPYRRHMSPQDRETLYRWSEEQLNAAKAGRKP